VKLGDFGISKRINEDSTLSGGGTPLFMAPEMRGYLPPGEEDSSITYHFTESIDIWSLGVTLFFLLFHDYPFTSKQPHKLPRYIAGGEFPFPTTNAPSLSQDCYRFLEAVMGRHPRNRLSAKEALESRWLSSLENESREETNVLNSPSKVDFESSTLTLELENLLVDEPADAPLLPIGLAYSTNNDTEQSNIQSVGDVDNSKGPSKEPFNHDITEKLPPNTLDTKAPTGSSTLESKDPLTFMPSSSPSSSSSSSSRSGGEIAEENLPENDRKNAISNPLSRIPGPIVPDADTEESLQNILASMRDSDNRGKALFEAEEYDKAEHFYEYIFESQKETFGTNNESTLQTCQILGKICYAKRNYGRALSFFNLCADEQEKIYGKFHSIPLQAKFWIGLAESKLGNFEKAEVILKEVVADQQALLGPSHKDTLETNHEIGRSLLSQKMWALASFFFQIAHSGRQKCFGSDHRLTIDSLFYTGYTSQKLGNHGEAVSTLKKVLNVWRGKRGLWDIDTIRAACILGESLYELNEFPEATGILQDALSRARVAETADDPQILRGGFFLGNCLVGLNDYQKANFAYREAADGQKKALGPADPETLESIYHVGFTHMKLGQYEDAQSLLESVQEAYRWSTEVLSPGHSLYTRSSRDLGFVQYALNQFVKAERNLTYAVNGAISLWGLTHESTLYCLFWHCKVQCEMQMLEGAETTCRKLIASETEAYEYPRPETLDLMELIVEECYRTCDLEKAESLCLLLKHYRMLKGENERSTRKAKRLYAEIWGKMQKREIEELEELEESTLLQDSIPKSRRKRFSDLVGNLVSLR
jgi:tetratricopeptide (TPR) repeat protein